MSLLVDWIQLRKKMFKFENMLIEFLTIEKVREHRLKEESFQGHKATTKSTYIGNIRSRRKREKSRRHI